MSQAVPYPPTTHVKVASGSYKGTNGTTIGVLSDGFYTVSIQVPFGDGTRNKEVLFTPSQLERL